MFRIKKDEKKVYRHQLEKHLKAKGITVGVKFFEEFFGEYNDCPFVIHHKYVKLPKTSKLQRFNHFWVIPLFMLSIPITYVILGGYHIDRHSKLGLILEQLLGEYN